MESLDGARSNPKATSVTDGEASVTWAISLE